MSRFGEMTEAEKKAEEMRLKDAEKLAQRKKKFDAARFEHIEKTNKVHGQPKPHPAPAPEPEPEQSKKRRNEEEERMENFPKEKQGFSHRIGERIHQSSFNKTRPSDRGEIGQTSKYSRGGGA